MKEHLTAGIDRFSQAADVGMLELTTHSAKIPQVIDYLASEIKRDRFSNLRKRIWLVAVPLFLAVAAACSKEGGSDFESRGFQDQNNQKDNTLVEQTKDEDDTANEVKITILDPDDKDLPARVGDTLKDFEFEGIDGRVVSYYKNEGKPLIVLMCCGRPEELEVLSQVQNKYQDRGLQTIVVLRYINDPNYDNLPVNLTQIIEDSGSTRGAPFKFANILNPKEIPAFFAIDRNGTVIEETYDPSVVVDLANLIVGGEQVKPLVEKTIDKDLPGYGFDRVYEDLINVAYVFSLIHHDEYNTFDTSKFKQAFEEYKVGVDLARNSGGVLTPAALDYFLRTVDLTVSGYCDNQDNPDSTLIEQTLKAFSSYIAIQYEKMAQLGRMAAEDWPQIAARFTPNC